MTKAKVGLAYYGILSVLFLAGRMYIIEANKMRQGPVPTEAFQRLFDWVHLFSYFFVVPLLIIGLVATMSWTKRKGFSMPLTVTLCLLYAVLAFLAGIVLRFAFVLIFYGFAP